MTHEELIRLSEESIKRSEELIKSTNDALRELHLMSVYGRRIERLELVDFTKN